MNQISTPSGSAQSFLDSRTGHAKFSVLLVDSEALVRQALRSLINSFDNFQVTEEVATKGEALEVLQRGTFDLVCTEIDLSDDTGLSLVQELARNISGTHSIVISSNLNVAVVQQAMSFGAKAYIHKSSSAEELRIALNKVTSNSHALPILSKQPHQKLNGGTSEGVSAGHIDPLNELSPREREIFHLLASGLQNTVIAKKLFISPRTVETHRARIVRKLNLVSNGELIRFAIRHGLSAV